MASIPAWRGVCWMAGMCKHLAFKPFLENATRQKGTSLFNPTLVLIPKTTNRNERKFINHIQQESMLMQGAYFSGRFDMAIVLLRFH